MPAKPQLKTPEQVRLMRAAGLVVAQALRVTAAAVEPGVTTGQLDRLAETVIRDHGATPSFLGYHGFPASTCISVGAEVVHGIPLDTTVIPDGALVSIDCGAIVDGWHGDAAVTVLAGAVGPAAQALSADTERALWAGIAAATAGARLGGIGAAIEEVAVAGGYGIPSDFTGHGIGTEMHQAPDVHNRAGGRGGGLRLTVGHVLAIEPMFTLGDPEIAELDDGWTAVTADRQPAAHWEHTVAITASGPWVLTAEDGGESRLAAPTGARARIDH